MTDDDTTTIEIEVSPAVEQQIEAAAELVDKTPEELCEIATLNHLQAVDNILHGDALIDIPEDFDTEAWRERYEQIRWPETY